MDIRFVIVLMVIAMVMDFLGRMARKRQAALPPDQDGAADGAVNGAADGADILGVLRGEELEPRERREHRPSGETSGPADRLPAGGRSPSAQQPGRLTAPREAAGFGVAPAVEPPPEPVRDVPAPRERRPEPAARTWELRDRSPRKIEVRSREPRSPERPQAAAGAPRAEVARQPVAAPPAVPAAAARDAAGGAADVAPAAEGLGDRLGLGNAAALRRAVLVREVLGPPLAMRDRGRGGAGGR